MWSRQAADKLLRAPLTALLTTTCCLGGWVKQGGLLGRTVVSNRQTCANAILAHVLHWS